MEKTLKVRRVFEDDIGAEIRMLIAGLCITNAVDNHDIDRTAQTEIDINIC